MAPHHAAKARLKIVGAADASDQRDPAQELAFLFAHEAQLRRQLADVGTALEAARRRLAGARSDGMTQALPRMELLRTRYGPPAEPRQ